RRALPPSLAIFHAVDGKVEVGCGRIGIAGASDPADRVAAFNRRALLQAWGIVLQMRIIIGPAAVGRADIGRDPTTAMAEEQLFDRAWRCSNDWCASRSHDVDGIMHAAAGAGLGEGIEKLVRLHTDDRNGDTRWTEP